MIESDASGQISQRRNEAARQRVAPPRLHPTEVTAKLNTTVVAAAVALMLGGAGCSLLQPGVPLAKTTAAAAPKSSEGRQQGVAANDDGRAPSPADLMFQSTDSPFARTPSSAVNVFGEVDGVGPAIFAGGRGGFQQHTFVDEGFDADPDASPDGKWLLFSSTRHSDRSDIYVQRTDGLAVTQLTNDPGDDAFPRFSPDGKQIAFASNRSGNWDIYVMDVEGKNVRQVTRSMAQDIHPSFSPDGNRIVYSALGGKSGQWELWVVDLRNDERRMIGYGLFPEWSPRKDRDVIAFQRARQRGTRWFSAWTLELADGDAKNLTEIAYSTNAAVVAPTWSPDGKRLAFCTIANPQATNTDKKPAAKATGDVATRKVSEDVWTVNADGTDRTRITDGRGTNATPIWANDGRIYFISDRGGAESIWSAPAGVPRGDATAHKPSLPDAEDEGPQPTAALPTEEH